MIELEAHQLLTLMQQLIDRQQVLETMKKTHAERHFGPITELPRAVTDGLYGLRMRLWSSLLQSMSARSRDLGVSWTEGEPPVLLKD